MESIESLIKKIVLCAYEVRKVLKPGYLESIYKNAMFLELKQQGLKVSTEVPFHVTYKGHVLGDFRADIVVEDRVILELKAIEHLNKAHEIQLVNYLMTTGIDVGLLINFGCLESFEIKRKYRVYKPKGSTSY
jgi:GxxExxY protein